MLKKSEEIYQFNLLFTFCPPVEVLKSAECGHQLNVTYCSNKFRLVVWLKLLGPCVSLRSPGFNPGSTSP